jgi:phage terminase large subunit-like protein
MLNNTFDVQEIVYDPRFFELPAQILHNEGLPMLEMPQSIDRMVPAYGNTLRAIKDGIITHDGNTDFTTQVLNAAPMFNERGFMLKKAKSKGKIDACVALSMMVSRAYRPKPEKEEAWAI